MPTLKPIEHGKKSTTQERQRKVCDCFKSSWEKVERDRILLILNDKLSKIDADPENETGNAIDRTHLAGMRIALLNAIAEIEKI